MSQSDMDFFIPEFYKRHLTWMPSRDTRKDSQILVDIARARPVTGEKNIWAFWDKGLSKMPHWCQRNVISWARKHGPDGWTVRVLDQVPTSSSWAVNFIPSDMLPRAFVQGSMSGEHAGQHAADLVRGALLYLHGGVYMDVGCILFRHLEDVCWRALTDPAIPYTIATPWMHTTTMANHFIAARKGDKFIKMWHDLFHRVWEDREDARGLAHHPLLLPLLQNMATRHDGEKRYEWDLKVNPIDLFEYVAQVMCWNRLCHIEEPGEDGFKGPEYWSERILIWDALPENWPAENELGFQMGDRFLELMGIVVNDIDNPDWEAAHNLVFTMLSHSIMQKVTHGKNLTHTPALGTLLDMEEHEDVDIMPGTFFSFLRRGVDNYRQHDRQIRYVQAQRPRNTMRKGVFEA